MKAEDTKKTEEAASSMTLEENMEQLKQVLKELESGEHSLEDSFTLYEKGMKLVKQASSQIDSVEKKILVLKEDGGYGEL